MNSIFLNSKLSDDERRARLYRGQVFLYSASPAAQRFVALAREMIHEAFPLRPHRIPGIRRPSASSTGGSRFSMSPRTT